MKNDSAFITRIKQFWFAVVYVLRFGTVVIVRDISTGAYRRDWFMKQLAPIEIERARRHKHPLSVCVLDLDGLKTVNDTQGHLAGDGLLKEFVYKLMRYCRRTDLIVRLGGDEFMILFSETTVVAAQSLIKRIQEDNPDIKFSAGFACWFPEWSQLPHKAEGWIDLDRLIREADERMYEEKRSHKKPAVEEVATDVLL